MPVVGSVHLVREVSLHPVKRRVKHVVLEPEACERAGEDLGDWRLRYMLKRNICGHAGDGRQSVRLDEASAVVFTLNHGLVRTVLEVPQETGGQSGEVTFELLESHDCGEPVGRDLHPDGEELTGPALVGAIPNHK